MTVATLHDDGWAICMATRDAYLCRAHHVSEQPLVKLSVPGKLAVASCNTCMHCCQGKEPASFYGTTGGQKSMINCVGGAATSAPSIELQGEDNVPAAGLRSRQLRILE